MGQAIVFSFLRGEESFALLSSSFPTGGFELICLLLAVTEFYQALAEVAPSHFGLSGFPADNLSDFGVFFWCGFILNGFGGDVG